MTRYKEALDDMDERLFHGKDHEEYSKAYWLDDHWDTIRQALSSMIEKEDMFALIKTCRDYTQPWAVDSIDDLEVLQKAMKTIHDDVDAMVRKYEAAAPEGESE